MNVNNFTNVLAGTYKDSQDLMLQFDQYKQHITGKFPAIADTLQFLLVTDSSLQFIFATYKVKK